MSSSSRSPSPGFDRDLTLEIVRDEGVCGDWLNRFARNPETNEVLYYLDVFDDSNVEVHRGNKYGPVIARSRLCRSSPRATDLLVTDPRSLSGLQHIHHDERTHATHFVGNGQRYHWKGSELVDDSTGVVVAEMSSAKDTFHRKSGKLVIKAGAFQNLTDPIVMTAMIAQERADESKSYF